MVSSELFTLSAVVTVRPVPTVPLNLEPLYAMRRQKRAMVEVHETRSKPHRRHDECDVLQGPHLLKPKWSGTLAAMAADDQVVE